MPTAWLENISSNSLKYWLTHTSAPMLRSKLDGTIISCNLSFEKEFGWTSDEFLREGITWTHITTKESDAENDLIVAEQVAKGERFSYLFTKSYNCKNGPPKEVVIHVIRNPDQPKDIPLRDTEFFVTVMPAGEGWKFLLETISNLEVVILSQNNALEKVISVQEELLARPSIGTSLNNFVINTKEWSKNNKILSSMIFIIMLGYIAGFEKVEWVVEIIKKLFS